jgi:hypothetical protein
MIIYHKTNNEIRSTEVIYNAKGSNISHGNYVWDKHRENVDKLEDGGDVFVTGGTYYGAIYEGKLEQRASFANYLESDIPKEKHGLFDKKDSDTELSNTLKIK